MTVIDLDKPLAPSELTKLLKELRTRLERGMSPDGFDLRTGLPWLHVAVGRDLVPAVKLLLEFNVKFGPDRFDRWPSTVAAICEVSEEMCDLVVEAEALWLEQNDTAELAPAQMDGIEFLKGISLVGGEFKDWVKANLDEDPDRDLVKATESLLYDLSDREVRELRELLATGYFRGEMSKLRFEARSLLVTLQVIRSGIGLPTRE